MKTLKRLFLLVTLFGAALGMAANDLDQHPAVRDALNADPVLLYTYYGAQIDGYTLQEADVHPIYYVIAPVGEHDDCTVELTLTRSQGNNSLQVDYITILVQILDDGEGNLWVGDFTVERETVQ